MRQGDGRQLPPAATCHVASAVTHPLRLALLLCTWQVSNLSLGQYFEQHIFQPLGLNATFYDTTNGAAGIHPAALTNAGYVSTLTAASGPGAGGATLDWTEGAATWAPGISDAPHYEGLNALTLGAGGWPWLAAALRH